MRSILPKAVRDVSSELMRLPGIGPKTAQRLAIYLLRQPSSSLKKLANTLANLHNLVYTCSTCFNISEQQICSICLDNSRDQSILCVVEDALDVEAIERTGSYAGMYHVLGGVLSPLEGIGSEQLSLQELFTRIQTAGISELIIALDHNMEGEATARHILSKIDVHAVSVTRLARGLPTGGDIEFADATTLTAALQGRKQL